MWLSIEKMLLLLGFNVSSLDTPLTPDSLRFRSVIVVFFFKSHYLYNVICVNTGQQCPCVVALALFSLNR